MKRYKIWDKVTPIVTPGVDLHTGKQVWQPQEYIDAHAQWASIPDVKVIITNGVINGGVFMEFGSTVEFYKKQGANITDEMSDEEVLQVIEDFEDNPPASELLENETDLLLERVAAALEFSNILNLPDVEEE